MMFSKILLASLALSLLTPSFASAAALNASEQLELESYLGTEVRADLNANLEERIAEVDSKVTDSILMGEPLSPETRRVLSDGVYRILFGTLAKQGIYLARAQFEDKIGAALDFASRLGVFPRAFTVGYMARLQHGVGGSIGTQFNFYFSKGLLKMSTYSVYGVQAGYQAGKPTLQRKIELYAAFCFGACVGGDKEGYYLGFDGYAGAGIGSGAFIEVGIDVTDFKNMIRDRKLKHKDPKVNVFSLKKLYQDKAIYVGFGFDIGFGAGISGNAFFYSQDNEITLGKSNDPLLSLQMAKSFSEAKTVVKLP